ncbi:hypothetical protein AX774_g906 [Zancudomyces culisetae]|uniref:Uncharacterized protein n=1 Tax=Zancudomyces culisetae TaxID=1213189 RepID=A0A1R1PX89_ZANCU|nr:hypothetical protein AX774_g906 [Zancudomyces culisetae]|eukprot:OMH85517.1 hypothetical protein AX774_g906 [Zancudomyces culisetae]
MFINRLDSTGNKCLMSAEPRKIPSKYTHCLCTSIHTSNNTCTRYGDAFIEPSALRCSEHLLNNSSHPLINRHFRWYGTNSISYCVHVSLTCFKNSSNPISPCAAVIIAFITTSFLLSSNFSETILFTSINSFTWLCIYLNAEYCLTLSESCLARCWIASNFPRSFLGTTLAHTISFTSSTSFHISESAFHTPLRSPSSSRTNSSFELLSPAFSSPSAALALTICPNSSDTRLNRFSNSVNISSATAARIAPSTGLIFCPRRDTISINRFHSEIARLVSSINIINSTASTVVAVSLEYCSNVRLAFNISSYILRVVAPNLTPNLPKISFCHASYLAFTLLCTCPYSISICCPILFRLIFIHCSKSSPKKSTIWSILKSHNAWYCSHIPIYFIPSCTLASMAPYVSAIMPLGSLDNKSLYIADFGRLIFTGVSITSTSKNESNPSLDDCGRFCRHTTDTHSCSSRIHAALAVSIGGETYNVWFFNLISCFAHRCSIAPLILQPPHSSPKHQLSVYSFEYSPQYLLQMDTLVSLLVPYLPTCVRNQLPIKLQSQLKHTTACPFSRNYKYPPCHSQLPFTFAENSPTHSVAAALQHTTPIPRPKLPPLSSCNCPAASQFPVFDIIWFSTLVTPSLYIASARSHPSTPSLPTSSASTCLTASYACFISSTGSTISYTSVSPLSSTFRCFSLPTTSFPITCAIVCLSCSCCLRNRRINFSLSCNTVCAAFTFSEINLSLLLLVTSRAIPRKSFKLSSHAAKHASAPSASSSKLENSTNNIFFSPSILTNWSLKSLDIISTNASARYTGYVVPFNFLLICTNIASIPLLTLYTSVADSNSFNGKSFISTLYFDTTSAASLIPVSAINDTVAWNLFAALSVSITNTISSLPNRSSIRSKLRSMFCQKFISWLAVTAIGSFTKFVTF